MTSLLNKPSFIDLFKRFKVLDLENLEKLGNVKLLQVPFFLLIHEMNK